MGSFVVRDRASIRARRTRPLFAARRQAPRLPGLAPGRPHVRRARRYGAEKGLPTDIVGGTLTFRPDSRHSLTSAAGAASSWSSWTGTRARRSITSISVRLQPDGDLAYVAGNQGKGLRGHQRERSPTILMSSSTAATVFSVPTVPIAPTPPRRASRWRMVLDGKEGQPFDAIRT